MSRKPVDPFDHPFFTNNGTYRPGKYKPTKRFSLFGFSAAVAGGILATIGVVLFVVLAFAGTAALLGWAGMVLAGIFGYPFGFYKAWAVGALVLVILGIIRN